MSKAAKVLILTWVAIGFLIVGAAGFYLGRITAPKPQGRMMQQGGQQPPQGGFQQSPPGTNQGPAPSGAGQERQQNFGQPPLQK